MFIIEVQSICFRLRETKRKVLYTLPILVTVQKYCEKLLLSKKRIYNKIQYKSILYYIKKILESPHNWFYCKMSEMFFFDFFFELLCEKQLNSVNAVWLANDTETVSFISSKKSNFDQKMRGKRKRVNAYLLWRGFLFANPPNIARFIHNTFPLA